MSNTINSNRRNFIKKTGTLALGATLPISVVELAFAESSENFSFAYISDAHIQHIKGNSFVRNWDKGLTRAVAETNLLTPKKVIYPRLLKPRLWLFSLTHRYKRYIKAGISGQKMPNRFRLC